MKLGYEMYETSCNYVVWINMRDITRNPNNPSLEDIALNILQQFNIDTFEIEDKIVEYLKKKLNMIADDSKSALLIFDNADNLIEPESDESCQSSAFEKLYQLVRDMKGNSIRCMFTSRVCKGCLDDRLHKVALGYLSDADSRLFVTKELEKLAYQCKDSLIEDFVASSHGLPYALKLMCSVVARMSNEEMIIDYVNDLKESPLGTLDDDCRLTKLFNLSYKRLKSAERSVFTSMAVFPSAFSYKYLSKVLKNLEDMKLKPRLLDSLIQNSLVSEDSGRYLIHPYLREFVKSKYWNEDSRSKYDVAYYKVYISQFFELARDSLEKDNFACCLKEFRGEQQNFLHLITQIGKGSINNPPYLRGVMKELLARPTPEYIYLMIFYYHELYSVDMIEFFKGCETFVEGQMKKNIWCCRFYINFKSVEKKIDDDYQDIEADEYGKAVVEKVRLSRLRLNKDRRKGEFEEAISSLEKFGMWVDSLNDWKMKAYFKCKILKIKVRLSKRVYSFKNNEIDKGKLVEDLEEARDICQSKFGTNGLTIDCHSQLGKLFWWLDDADKALASYDDAVNMAKSLAISQNNNRYISSLIEKGRFLIDSKSKDAVLEGRRLIEDTLYEWKDVCSEFMWLPAMQSLVRVDRTKCDEVFNKFLKEKSLLDLLLRATDSAVSVQLNHSNEEVNEENFNEEEQLMVEKLRKVVDHLENICNTGDDTDKGLLQDAMEGRRLIEDTLYEWKDVCSEFMWLPAMQSLVRVDRTKCDEVFNKFLKEKSLLDLLLRATDSAVSVQLNHSNEEVNEENFNEEEQLMVEKLRKVVDHLENICNTGDDTDKGLLQDAIKYTYVWNMWIATRCMHALSESDAKQLASKALDIMNSHHFIRSDRREELSFILNCNHEKFVLLRKKCDIEQMGNRIPVKKNDVEKDLESLLQECEKHQDVWSWVIGGLIRENRKLYEKVTPYLLRQSEPNDSLLTLVLQMFVYQIEAYKKDSRASVPLEESIPAVKDILRAIKHVEALLAKKTMQEHISRAQKDALKRWYTQLAVRTKECLSRADRSRYARKALGLLEEGDTCITDRERQILTKLAS